MSEYLQELTMECDYCEAMKGEACSPKCEKEEELSQALTNLLDTANTKESK